MDKITLHEGIAVPIKQSNVDTDTIIPKQFLKSVERTGFGVNLFDLWRYKDVGQLGQDCRQRPTNPNFVLNQPRYQQASVLVVDQNFGCGSSREHAVWALMDYGFRVLIGKSYADIFYNNCFKNGLLPVTLLASEVDTLYQWIEETPTASIRIDLPAQTVEAGKHTFSFSIDGFRKKCLLEGLDEIGLTLTKRDKIRTFEMEYYQKNPWLT